MLVHWSCTAISKKMKKLHVIISQPFMLGFFILLILNRGKWLRSPVNIKEANKQVKIYVGRTSTLHIFCFMFIDYA